MGQPKEPPLKTWEDFASYKAPDPDDESRYRNLKAQMEEYKDCYLIGGLGITGFNIVTFIRGFEETLEDLYTEREQIEKLTDLVMDFECGVIRNYAKLGFDAIYFGDDWGTQNSLMISPTMWREIFKPRYQRQFKLAHDLGMSVYFHCCGYIWDIIPDLIEIGVDILNLNQPDIFGVEVLGEAFAGKVCLNCPVDHQTLAVQGTKDEIFDYVRRLKKHLGQNGGGFIGYIEEYSSIGMSPENYQYISEAFETE